MDKAKTEEKDAKKLKECISYLLEAGCDVCFGRIRVYKGAKEYTILVFDGNANIKMDQEENFDDLNDAVSKFIQRCGSKL